MERTILEVQGFDTGLETSISLLKVEGEHFGFVLQDKRQDEKIQGKTGIPAGIYDVKYRKVPSPKTEAYRKRYDWFTWHLELQDVPGFKYVYIHVGNTHLDTDGCLLVGYDCRYHEQDYSIAQSRKAFQKLYARLCRTLDNDGRVIIKVL